MAAQVTQIFSLMGSTFIQGATSLGDRLRPGQLLALVREPTNKAHKNAVLVMWGKRGLGYVPRNLADTIAPLMDAGVKVIVRKAPPLKGFGAFRGILELAYIPPDSTEAPAEEVSDAPIE